MIQITLDEGVADALCCYLDEEEVFPEVVSLLLRAIPISAPAPPTDRLSVEDILNLRYRYSRTEGVSNYTLRTFLQEHKSIADSLGAVWLINQFPGETGPAVEGYMVYHPEEDRYWFPQNFDTKDVVGYYHHPSGAFFKSNDSMIDYLIAFNYINRLV